MVVEWRQLPFFLMSRSRFLFHSSANLALRAPFEALVLRPPFPLSFSSIFTCTQTFALDIKKKSKESIFIELNNREKDGGND